MTMKRKRSPQDATLRNVRAADRKFATKAEVRNLRRLHAKSLDAMNDRVRALEAKLGMSVEAK